MRRADIEAALARVDLPALMEATEGSSRVTIGLVDGPVALDHPDLPQASVRAAAACAAGDAACAHGTFVAGILSARRGRGAPGVCPACMLLVRPVFAASDPAASPAELGAAVIDCVDGGARLVNISAAMQAGANHEDRRLAQALNLAARRGVLVVAAAGNRRTVAGSMLTRHPAVIPVTACSTAGRPLQASDVAASVGRHGLGAPGADVQSLAPGGGLTRMSGTSAATPFVTGAAALMMSLHPRASASMVRFSLLRGVRTPRRGVVPPLLHAGTARAVLETLVAR